MCLLQKYRWLNTENTSWIWWETPPLYMNRKSQAQAPLFLVMLEQSAIKQTWPIFGLLKSELEGVVMHSPNVWAIRELWCAAMILGIPLIPILINI